jgi:predicted RNase H-like HicB family nuclease
MMKTVKVVCWQDEGLWLGYLQDYPDYWTQGETPDELRANLRDLYADLTSGTIPGVRKVEELAVG